jgi:hypothetical protein
VGPRSLWKHYKDDTAHYEIISDVALLEGTKERAVVYQHLVTKQIWVRSFSDFHALVTGHPNKDGFVPRFTEVAAFPSAAPLPGVTITER